MLNNLTISVAGMMEEFDVLDDGLLCNCCFFLNHGALLFDQRFPVVLGVRRGGSVPDRLVSVAVAPGPPSGRSNEPVWLLLENALAEVVEAGVNTSAVAVVGASGHC